MAWHDSLTGLPNRRLFEDRVEQELVRSKRLGDPVCVFFVDLDRFKRDERTVDPVAERGAAEFPQIALPTARPAQTATIPSAPESPRFASAARSDPSSPSRQVSSIRVEKVV